MKPLDLLETARGLTELGPRRLSQANLRRAVSTAYYGYSMAESWNTANNERPAPA